MNIALLPPITKEERDAQEKSDALNKLVWITCRVCGLKSRVGLDNPALLCNPCRIEPIQTEAHVLHLRDAYRERLWRARAEWDEFLDGAPAESRERWARVVEARGRVAEGLISHEAFQATWRRALAAGGPFATLLRCREVFEGETEECNRALEQCQAALIELSFFAPPRPPAEGDM